MEEIKVGEYVSKKEYLKRYDSNVGYALHVQNSIKKDDYVRLNIGKIVRVIGIKEIKVNKKAIYYGYFDEDWFDSIAVENFSNEPIDLIEIGDFINGLRILDLERKEDRIFACIAKIGPKEYWQTFYKEDIIDIVTKEQFEHEKYIVGG